MKRLFVDVDGTLLVWQRVNTCDHRQHEAYGDKRHWRPHTRVIAFVREWAAANPDRPVIVWSGEGAEYARKWGVAFFPDTPHEAHAKGAIGGLTLAEDDIFIDDHPAGYWSGTVIDPYGEDFAA